MTPTEAARRARELQHPFDTSFQMPDHMLDAMFQVLTRGSEAVHRQRVERPAEVVEVEGQTVRGERE